MPENQSPETQKLDDPEVVEWNFNKADYSFVPGNHVWRQQGYYLVCTSCDLGHGIFVGPDKLMIGVNDTGEPILKTRKELGMA